MSPPLVRTASIDDFFPAGSSLGRPRTADPATALPFRAPRGEGRGAKASGRHAGSGSPKGSETHGNHGRRRASLPRRHRIARYRRRGDRHPPCSPPPLPLSLRAAKLPARKPGRRTKAKSPADCSAGPLVPELNLSSADGLDQKLRWMRSRPIREFSLFRIPERSLLEGEMFTYSRAAPNSRPATG